MPTPLRAPGPREKLGGKSGRHQPHGTPATTHSRWHARSAAGLPHAEFPRRARHIRRVPPCDRLAPVRAPGRSGITEGVVRSDLRNLADARHGAADLAAGTDAPSPRDPSPDSFSPRGETWQPHDREGAHALDRPGRFLPNSPLPVPRPSLTLLGVVLVLRASPLFLRRRASRSHHTARSLRARTAQTPPASHSQVPQRSRATACACPGSGESH